MENPNYMQITRSQALTICRGRMIGAQPLYVRELDMAIPLKKKASIRRVLELREGLRMRCKDANLLGTGYADVATETTKMVVIRFTSKQPFDVTVRAAAKDPPKFI